jgi:hypothetical protein
MTVGTAYVLTADSLDNIVWRGTKELRDDGELVHMVLAGEERLALEHLSKDAACTPDINLNIVLLPCEHDFRRSVVSGRDVTRHLRVLYTGETEVANLEIAVLVDEDVAGLQVAVHDASRVDVFQTTLFQVSAFSWICGVLLHTKIWYRKYWINCFSSGLEVSRRWRSVPRSSVTK